MPRIDAGIDHALAVRAIRDPAVIARLDPHAFSHLLDAAEAARLLGWVLSASEGRLLEHDPGWLRDRLDSLAVIAREYERALRWEIDRIGRAFLGTGVPWVLLKGAAYLALGLPPGRGRHVADIDLLVPIDRLAEAERALAAHGWRAGTLDPYDERYYREWMHELPPMQHEARRSIVDLHHGILPRTSRLRPDPARLVARAVTAGEARVLCPSHMVLHAAAHLFHDGEVAGAIRDVVDLDQLLRHFGRDAAFWSDLFTEAEALGLARPAFYAVRYASRFAGTPVPGDVVHDMTAWAPPAPVVALMDALVARALPASSSSGRRAAVSALYLRAHWLRMPPVMLARHLVHQSLRRDR